MLKGKRAKVLPETGHGENSVIDIFRLTLTICLGLTTILGGYFTYYVLSAYETRAAQESFRSVATHMELYSNSSFHAKVTAMNTLQTFLATLCPRAENWPYCVANVDDYNELAASLAHMATITTVDHEVKVYPGEIPNFINFVVDFYNSSGYPDIAAKASNGIYVMGKNGTEYVTESSEGAYSLLAPVIQVGYPRNNTIVMLNVYSGAQRIDVVDDILDCVVKYDGINSTITRKGIVRNCMKSSGIIYLAEDEPNRPATVLLAPMLIPINASYENALSEEKRGDSVIIHLRDETLLHVGSTSVMFHWDKALTGSVFPTTTGLRVVLSDPNSIHTFTFDKGIAKAVNDNDKHNYHYRHTSVKFLVSCVRNTDFRFRIKIYLDDTYESVHRTRAPIYGCIITVLVIVVSALQFLAYDYHVTKRHSSQDKAKKKYVRYISHGERNPPPPSLPHKPISITCTL